MNGCKKCPAFAKCTVTYRGSNCAALRATYGLDNDPEIVTNADRIRAMSDEELADFLEGEYGNMMPGTALSWLQQPTKEEATE